MFFVDANVVVYAASKGRYKRGSLAVLTAISDGVPGVTSVMALEEVWHLEHSGRVPEIEGATSKALDVFAAPLPATSRVLRAALQLDVKRLGTADRIHVATCHDAGITDIVTADRDFDEAPALRRVDPLDEVALDQLLNG
jgi:predicted nucleic acid-binding protein